MRDRCPLPAVVCSGIAFPLGLRVSEDYYMACERKYAVSNLEVFGEQVGFMLS